MPAKSKSLQKPPGIKFIEGATDILIIAPHGVQGKGIRKDSNTDILTRMIADKLVCSALINDSIKRSECDYNSIADATQDKRFIAGIRKVLDAKGPTLVIWIHGILEKNRLNEKIKMGIKGELDCLIGFGQPGRDTATSETLTKFKKLLDDQNFYAHDAFDGSRYCGWDRDNMNQWFGSQKKYNDLKKVQSIQLEFSIHRRMKKSVKNTAMSVSAALEALIRTDPKAKSQTAVEATQPQEAKAMVKAVSTIQERLPVKVKEAKAAVATDIKEITTDEVLVGKAYKFLKGIFVKHFQNAMLEAGEYIIQEFFEGDYERAKNPRNAVKIRSFGELTNRLKENSGHAPSKTWVYDAVKLAIDEYQFKNFRTYGKLSLSHKIRLAYVREPEIKRKLIEEAAQNNITFEELRKRIAEERKNNGNGSKPPSIFQAIKNPERLFTDDLQQACKFDSLNKLDDEKIDVLKSKADQKIEELNSEIERLSAVIEKYREHLTDYDQLINRIKAVKEWHAELKAREEGKEKDEPLKETSRLKKLKDAVNFMCFWRGYDYGNLCVRIFYHYWPIEEMSELKLERLLNAGKCNPENTCFKFEITKQGEYKRISDRKIQNRLKKGTFWLTEEQYLQRFDSKYYDY